MKQMTGYFGGYISKKQKMGQFELKKSIGALQPLQEKLQERNLQSASSQLAHITNRMFVTLEGKGILRAATEEFMLSSRHKPHDPLAAEFIRTFRHQHFHGKFYLDRFQALKDGARQMNINILLPRADMSKELPDQVAFYGFRNTHASLFYLSPWEFVQWFKYHRLQVPSLNYHGTVWTPAGKAKKKEESAGKKV